MLGVKEQGIGCLGCGGKGCGCSGCRVLVQEIRLLPVAPNPTK